MVSKAKLYSKLDELETQLKEGLIPHMKNAVESGNDLIFCVKRFNPFRELRNQTDSLTEEFVEMGSQIIELREKLGEPSDGIIAARICWYCREWGNAKSHSMTSSQRLAEQFLREIESE